MDRKVLVVIEEIENGYLLVYGMDKGLKKEKSFQWAVNNDQRKDLIQHVINLLGLKHDYEIKER
jgi:hypothetical protein